MQPGEYSAFCAVYLFFDDIDAGDHFGHRMFNLYTCVHLDKIEAAIFVKKFERAGTAIA